MKTNALSEHPSFLDKEFRDDLKQLADAPLQVVSSLKEWLASINELSETKDDKNWIPLARMTGKTIEELQALYRPVRWVSMVSRDDGISVSDLLDDLREAQVIAKDDLCDSMKELVGPVQKLVERAYDLAAPSLPLLRIKRIQTRCILVSEYEKSFDTGKDTPETYKPKVKALHPRVTLELSFWDDRHDDIGISLSEDDLNTLTKWLSLAKVELAVMGTAVPERLLPGSKQGEES